MSLCGSLPYFLGWLQPETEGGRGTQCHFTSARVVSAPSAKSQFVDAGGVSLDSKIAISRARCLTPRGNKSPGSSKSDILMPRSPCSRGQEIVNHTLIEGQFLQALQNLPSHAFLFMLSYRAWLYPNDIASLRVLAITETSASSICNPNPGN